MSDAFEAGEAFRNRCLRVGPHKPDIMVSLTHLHYVDTADPTEVWGSFIDEILLDHLPRLPHAWPADATGLVERSPELPELVRLRMVGPSHVDVIAFALTVHTAMSDNEASLPHVDEQSGGRTVSE